MHASRLAGGKETPPLGQTHLNKQTHRTPKRSVGQAVPELVELSGEGGVVFNVSRIVVDRNCGVCVGVCERGRKEEEEGRHNISHGIGRTL